MAGAFIGLAFIHHHGNHERADAGWGLSRLAGGLALSMGLIYYCDLRWRAFYQLQCYQASHGLTNELPSLSAVYLGPRSMSVACRCHVPFGSSKRNWLVSIGWWPMEAML
ncbi:hypothetical protein O9929_25720 [Vibrio lentus]|nr:hypothetical protein [Vibrio lentus]